VVKAVFKVLAECRVFKDRGSIKLAHHLSGGVGVVLNDYRGGQRNFTGQVLFRLIVGEKVFDLHNLEGLFDGKFAGRFGSTLTVPPLLGLVVGVVFVPPLPGASYAVADHVAVIS
jgi:hypothetical protein